MPPKSNESKTTKIHANNDDTDDESVEIHTRTVAPTLHDMLERINYTVRDGKEQRLTQEQQNDDSLTIPVNVVLTRARTIICDKAKDGIQVLHSPVHVEMTPHDVNFCDTKIVQSTLKTLFENNEFDLLTFGAVPSLSRFRRNDQVDDGGHLNPHFRIFIFNDVDKMSREAQTALRRIMEDYSKMARFILIAVNVDHIIAPIQSRCQIFRIPRPDDSQVRLVLESALVRVLPKDIWERRGTIEALEPYLAKICDQSQGNVTRALTIMHASLHSFMSNTDALYNALQRCSISYPDWLHNMRECVKQICQVNMNSEQGGQRHMYLKDTLGELLKRRVPTENIVRYLDHHIRRTLREQCILVLTSIDQLLVESNRAAQDGGETLNSDEKQFLLQKYATIKCQLASVCSDVSTACAFYETRSTKSQFSIIHVNALASCLIYIVGLYQNSLSIALNSKVRVCRPYSSVYDLARLLKHTMQTLKPAETHNEEILPTDSLVKEETTSNVCPMQIDAAKKMKEMCLASNSIAGVDWAFVLSNAATQSIDLQKILTKK